jgi:hypothetical protein
MGTNDEASTRGRGCRRLDLGHSFRADLPSSAAPPPGTTVMPPAPPPPPGSTPTTIAPRPDGDHREITIHKEVDENGNTVTEKEMRREGVSGSTETHTKRETNPEGETSTHSKTTITPH